jgi:nucleobase transporter 1/2
MSAVDAQIIYGLDDRPPPGHAMILALQHVLTMFGSTVAVPLLLGPAMGLDNKDIALLISSVMLCSGVATFLQATFGSRLPIIQGVSFSFLAAFLGIIATVTGSPDSEGLGGDGKMAMQYIAGAVIVGAGIEMLIGFSGLMGLIRRVLSPVVVGPVIMLIGLALYDVGAPVAATHWPTSIMTMCLIVLFAFILARRSRIFRMFPLLLAILVSCGVCYGLTVAGVYPGASVDAAGHTVAAHPAHVSFQAVADSQWLRVQSVVFPWGRPLFHAAFIVAVLAGYLASMIESFGDYHACSHMAGGGDPTPEQISRGIGFEGVGCALTGVLGGFSSTSYSENIGLVGLTKVGSRYVVQIAAVILVILGIFGKFGAVAAAIPRPIVGGLYCTLFGLISAVGVRQLAKADLNVDRNLFVAGFALFMGLSVPAYFDSEAGKAAMVSLGEVSMGLRDVVSAIGNTGMAVAAILGLLLDNLIPGTAEQRGLDVR